MANDVRVDVVTFDAPSSTGNQDITADLGGNTPKLVKFFLNWADIDESVDATFEFGVGAADGTTEFAMSLQSRDNLASTGVGRRSQKTRCIDLSADNNSANRTFATFVQFLSTTDTGDSTSGVRVNWLDTDAVSSRTPKVTAVFYSGADYEGSIGFITLSGTSDTGFYDPGHVTDLAEFYGCGQTFSAFGTFNIGSQGCASFSGSSLVAQRTAIWGEANSQASGEMWSYLRDDAVVSQVNTNDGSVSWRASVDISTGTRIQLTTDTGNASGDETAIISHNVDGLSVHVGTLTTPTSTGSFSYTSPGFEPQWAMLLPTMVRTINTSEDTDQGGVSGHIALGVDEDSCVAGSVEWAADPTNTNSVWADQAIYVLEDDGTVEFNGTKTGFQSNGIDFNFSSTNGTARLWGVAAIETATAETTLLINDAAHAQAADNVTLVQQNTLAITESSHSHTAGNVELVQQHVLSIAESLHSHAVDNTTLDVAAILEVQDANHGLSVDNIDLLQQNILSVDESIHAQSSDNASLDSDTIIVAQDSTHSQTTDNVDLVQQNILTIDESNHAHTADNTTLDVAAIIAIQNTLHAHTADNLGLVQQNILVVADSTHAHAADNATLISGAVLDVNEATHSHTSENIDLVQQNILSLDDSIHAHLADNIELAQQNVLVIANASHQQAADNATLDTFTQLLPDGAMHSHVALETSFVQQHILSVDESLHAHTADNVSLAQQQTLSIDDAQHSQTADNLDLSLELILSIEDATQGHSSDEINLIQQHILALDDANHAISSAQAVLGAEFDLFPQDSLHAHAAQNSTLMLGVPNLTGLGDRLMIIEPETRLMVVRN